MVSLWHMPAVDTCSYVSITGAQSLGPPSRWLSYRRRLNCPLPVKYSHALLDPCLRLILYHHNHFHCHSTTTRSHSASFALAHRAHAVASTQPAASIYRRSVRPLHLSPCFCCARCLVLRATLSHVSRPMVAMHPLHQQPLPPLPYDTVVTFCFSPARASCSRCCICATIFFPSPQPCTFSTSTHSLPRRAPPRSARRSGLYGRMTDDMSSSRRERPAHRMAYSSCTEKSSTSFANRCWTWGWPWCACYPY